MEVTVNMRAEEFKEFMAWKKDRERYTKETVSYTHLDRVKMWNGQTWPHYTRSAYAGNSDSFCLVNTDGTPANDYADSSRALAPSFWI